MCGITGAISFIGKTEFSDLKQMVLTLAHRGPDNQNIVQRSVGAVDIGLCHARLSIIDLTDAASQPMSFLHLTIVFNGEIYNFREIRADLEKLGHQFHTHSDTEVVLHAFAQWKEAAVHKFIGMFAFVLLDEKQHKLFLFRDRAGIKPLHYYWDHRTLIFGSELKAILKHPSFKKHIDDQAVGSYFKMGYVPCPSTIYRDTFKISPGHYAVLNLNTRQFEIRQYWNSIDYFQRPKLNISYEDAKAEIVLLLISSCNYRMIADVPVGVFLSGGYDSTAVAAILQKERTEKLKTFTIGFEEGNNEAPYAKQTAEYLGTDHLEYYCTPREAQDLIPELPYYFDEPFSDSSAIPTLLVSRLAKSKVTVALSADAGDELFAGYDSYRSLYRNVHLLKLTKYLNKHLTANIAERFSNLLKSESFLAQKLLYLRKVLLKRPQLRASLIHQGAQSLAYRIYENLMMNIAYPTDGLELNQDLFNDPISVGQAIDYNLYFPNDILTKVDRATMAVSLEGREPLVDHRLFEFVAQLPIEYKFDGTVSKKLLKDIVHDYVPKDMMDRPKRGFSVPIDSWLKGDLLPLLNDIYNEKKLKQTGFFNVAYALQLKKLFLNGKLHASSIIWKLLQFHLWHDQWNK